MSFDLSRNSFRPLRDFAQVVQQQGRVQLDSDLNENSQIQDRRARLTDIDLAGRRFYPAANPQAFQISVVAGKIMIGRGRYHVDGLVAENHGSGADEWDPALDEQRAAGPLPYADQPFIVAASADTTGVPQLAYLDVWRRAVTFVEDPALVEAAVGVDSAARLQTVWRVRLLPLARTGASCGAATDSAAWQVLTAPAAARLTNGASDQLPDPNPCVPPPATGYRGLENQLYRVEIHDGGDQTAATWKWSRDNASVMTAVRAVDAARTRLSLDSLGRDHSLSFHDGDWVEVTDIARELEGLPGFLTRILAAGGIDTATRTVRLAEALPAGMFPVDAAGRTDPARGTRMVRWDQAGPVLDATGNVFADLDAAGFTGGIPLPAAGVQVAVESGLTVAFDLAGSGNYRTGDHWLFAARAADATFAPLTLAPPAGIHHHHAPLAVVGTVVDDCRTPWPSADCACACTIVVEPGDDLAALPGLMPANRLVHVCLAAGEFRVKDPVTLSGLAQNKRRGHLRLTGAGGATRISTGDECVFQLQDWDTVDVSDFAVLSGVDFITRRRQVGIMGAITVRDCGDVNIRHIHADCAGSGRQEAACLRVYGGPNEGEEPALRTVVIRDCLLLAGVQVTGILVTDAQQSDISGNRVRRSTQQPDTEDGEEPPTDSDNTPSRAAAGHTGIRVAGSFAREVRIAGNSVADTVRGIHIAFSHDAPRDVRDVADRVLVSANRIDLWAPTRASARDSNGIFIGNCDSVIVRDNTVAFTGDSFASSRMGSGICIAGLIGRMAIVQNNHLLGARIGIRMEANAVEPRPLWLIAENLAQGATDAVDAPAQAILRDNLL